jgi:sulfonate transport system permease protein
MPSFKAISLVPVLGWLPLFIMLIGIEESLKVLIIAKAVIVPVTINTVKGIRNIAPGHFEVARIYRFSPLQTLSRLIVPSACPASPPGCAWASPTPGWRWWPSSCWPPARAWAS